jgi:hypothetical protein
MLSDKSLENRQGEGISTLVSEWCQKISIPEELSRNNQQDFNLTFQASAY